MHFQLKYFWQYTLKLLPYIRVTIEYVIVALLLGFLIGFVLTIFKVGKNPVLKAIGNIYTAIFRSIPPVVLLFLVYYGLPIFVHVDSQNRLFYVCVTLTLLSSAMISEIMRSAYNSVPKGQYEAAVTVGLTPFQAIRRIVLPQALNYALPNLSTIIIGLLKDGSLAFTIGLIDVFGKANTLNNVTFSKYVLEIYLSLTLIYWIAAFIIEQIAAAVEAKVSNKKNIKKINENYKEADR